MTNPIKGQFLKTRNHLFNIAEIQVIACQTGHGGGVVRMYLRGRHDPIEVDREDFDLLVKALDTAA